MTYILMHLHMKEVRFKKCYIMEQVVQVAVATLKSYQHPFLLVHLFDSKSGYDANNWRDPEWKERISREIFLLCCSNNFQVDCNTFIMEFVDPSARFKHRLHSFCFQGGVDFNMLWHLHCCNRDKKLWYAGIMAAIKYDKEHDFLWLGDSGQPNMLYFLIREHPNNLKGV